MALGKELSAMRRTVATRGYRPRRTRERRLKGFIEVRTVALSSRNSKAKAQSIKIIIM